MTLQLADRATAEPRRHRFVLPGLALYAAVLFLWSALRHAHYGSHAYDLGAYHQVFWNVAHGSLWNPIEQLHQWSLHIEVALLPVGALYRIAPTPLWLFAIQAGACASAGLPVEALARRFTADAGLAALCTAATLLTPQLLFASIIDFHSLTLCVLPIAILVLGIETDRARLVILGAALALALREQMGLALVAAAIGWAARHGRARLGSAVWLAALGLGAFLVQILWLMPFFGRGRPFLYIATNYPFGATPREALATALAHPLKLVTLPFEGRRRLVYPVVLASGAVAPVLVAIVKARRLALLPLLVALPLLLVQLYSVRVPVFSVEFHYGAPLVPLVGIAASIGVAVVAKRSKSRAQGLAATWLGVTALHAALAVGPLAFVPGGPLDAAFVGSPRQAALGRVIAALPRDASVSAHDVVTPHIVGDVRLWPDAEETARFVVLDTNVPSREISMEEVAAACRRLKADPRFVTRFDEAGVLLVERSTAEQ